MYYFFQLGFAPKLAHLELAHLLSLHRVKFHKETLSPQVVIIRTKSGLDLKSIVDQSGGIVRAGEYLFETDAKHLTAKLIHYLHHQHTQITFALSCPDPKILSLNLIKQIKNDLKNLGHSVRYLISDHVYTDPIILTSQPVIELVITPNHNRLQVFVTRAVTNPLSWAKRDRGRPQVDSHSGVMPPKISRILVNLSLNCLPTPQTLFYDPFCGSGTLLAEAMMLGMNVMGTDNDPLAIKNSTQNLNWLQDEFHLTTQSQLMVADATSVRPDDLGLGPISAIATESYLGPADNQPSSHLKPIILALKDLYTQTLANLASFLPRKGRLVIALARHHDQESVKMLSDLIDTCEKVGYTLLAGPIIYSQKHARVRRAIYILQKN